jgi:hypothetical protein
MEIARIGAGLDQAEKKLAESLLIKRYVEQQKHLHELKVRENSVSLGVGTFQWTMHGADLPNLL